MRPRARPGSAPRRAAGPAGRSRARRRRAARGGGRRAGARRGRERARDPGRRAARRRPRRARRRPGDARRVRAAVRAAVVAGRAEPAAPGPGRVPRARARGGGAGGGGERGAGRGVRFPDGATFAPVRIRVAVERASGSRARRRGCGPTRRRSSRRRPAPARPTFGAGGGYDGPLAHRQGKPMRPDVALAFDRMAAAARARTASTLVISSGFRTDAEQAVLFAAPPRPEVGRAARASRCTATATELDLGPPSAYAWLAANARAVPLPAALRVGAVALGLHAEPALDAARRRATATGGGRAARSSCPPASPPRSTAPRSAGASPPRCSPPSSTPRAASTRSWSAPPAPRGSPSSCPAPPAAYGLDDPFDADAAIDAQAHLMRDLLRQFGAVPLALAAYNAGPAPVAALRLHPAVPGDARLRRPDPRPDGRRGRAGRVRRRSRARGAAGGLKLRVESRVRVAPGHPETLRSSR